MIESTTHYAKLSTQSLSQTAQSRPGVTNPRTSPPAVRDAVELSAAAGRGNDQTAIRHDLVNRVRAEIESGTYFSEEKLDSAIDRLHRELFAD